MKHSWVEIEAWNEIRDTDSIIRGEALKVSKYGKDPATALIQILIYMNRITGALKMLKEEGL